MTMKNNNLTNLKKYSNKWIAINGDDKNAVIVAGKTLREVISRSKEKGVENPILTRTPSNYGAFIL